MDESMQLILVRTATKKCIRRLFTNTYQQNAEYEQAV